MIHDELEHVSGHPVRVEHAVGAHEVQRLEVEAEPGRRRFLGPCEVRPPDPAVEVPCVDVVEHRAQVPVSADGPERQVPGPPDEHLPLRLPQGSRTRVIKVLLGHPYGARLAVRPAEQVPSEGLGHVLCGFVHVVADAEVQRAPPLPPSVFELGVRMVFDEDSPARQLLVHSPEHAFEVHPASMAKPALYC